MSQGAAQFQKDRLREAREARGLTGIALAGLIGVRTGASISHYENGRHIPTVETVRRIAEVLRLPMNFFFLAKRQKPEGFLFWRSQSAASGQDRTRAHRKYEWLLGVVDYLSSYIAFPEARFPSFETSADPRDVTEAAIESMAKDCRRFWSLGDQPISNVTLLLENHGAIVVRCSMGSDYLDAYSHWHHEHRRPYLILATDKDSGPRSIVDIAHELGHMVLHRNVEERLFRTGEIHSLMEQQAKRFAGAFLLPPMTFASDLYSITLEAFLAMKPKWRVSVQAMIMRASQLGIVSPDDARRLWIRIARRGWKHEEPLDSTMEIEQPRMVRRCFDLLLDGDFNPEAMAAALALPLFDIEEVCGLPAGYFDNHQGSPLAFKLT